MISILESRAQRTGWWHGATMQPPCMAKKKSEETNVLQKWGLHVLGGLGTSLHQLILVKGYWPRLMQDAFIKYYDIQKEAQRADYTIHNGGLQPDCKNFRVSDRSLAPAVSSFGKCNILRFAAFPNITSSILHVQDQMWIQNDAWLKHLLNQMIRDHPAPWTSWVYLSTVFFFFFFGLRICGA